MARPRRETDYTALYVRIPSEEAEKLHRAADVLRTPKRELITRLVADFEIADNEPSAAHGAISRRADRGLEIESAAGDLGIEVGGAQSGSAIPTVDLDLATLTSGVARTSEARSRVPPSHKERMRRCPWAAKHAQSTCSADAAPRLA